MAKKKQFPLRLDPAVYEALEKWAGDEFRSVNSHIEFLLRDALKRAGRVPKKAEGERGEE
ncbi:Arc family DNA-binding protein [Tumebacillus sp. DT12]|uniref:Arc family DNA-binding protein n=1 Tax=Tumebacillus lacus TaxID=2995335 RepID=A0ABT3X2W7_9BACL|nr:Arc family DNA-binding protein [Tumebacillus lacus]MCX7571261.1 Arc family DNA-binding protein [Tumebacillus lacus]